MALKLKNDSELAEDPEVCRLIQAVSELMDEAFESRNRNKREKNISVFTSSYTAPCLVMALSDAPNASDAYKCLERCAKYGKNQMPDEALYGRVGYLAGILALLNGGHPIPESTVSNVSVYVYVTHPYFC